jgi:hypothetical protein
VTACSYLAHHDDHVLSTHDVIKPAREQAGIGGTGATTNLVGIGQGQADAITMVGQQIRMTVQDVLFPLFR